METQSPQSAKHGSMASAREIRVEPISAKDASKIVSSLHYSGRAVQNSQLHLGVFLNGKCGGAMQFGPSIDKRKMLGIVRGTKWNEFIELNRMAFSDWLPRNSESRAIGYAMRWMRKKYPHLKWVVSFADATQCGDGTIYRASGFILTQIKRNKTMLRMPDGSVVADKTLNNNPVQNVSWWRARGAKPLDGFQLRYLFFLHPEEKKNLCCTPINFSEIDRIGAGMYKGTKRVESAASGTTDLQSVRGGANPTSTLSSLIELDGGADATR